MLKPNDYYFTVHHIEDANKPDHASPFMKTITVIQNSGKKTRHKPTSKAQIVFENLYRITEDKETLLTQIENGELCYCIYKNNPAQPVNAKPLYQLSKTESEKIKTECKNFMPYIRGKIILNESLKLMSFVIHHTIENPVPAILFILSTMFFAAASAQRVLNNGFTGNNIVQNNFGDRNHEAIRKIAGSGSAFPNTFAHGTGHDFDHTKHANAFMEKFPPLHDPVKRRAYVLETIRKNDLRGFQHAINEGFSVFERTQSGVYVVLEAAKLNAFNILRHIAMNNDLNMFQPDSKNVWQNILLIALMNNHQQLANKLLEWGYDINHRFEHGTTLLHVLLNYAVPGKKEYVLNMIKGLIDLGADINIQEDRGLTPLHFAALENDLETMELFLSQKNCITTVSDEKNATMDLLSYCMRECSPKVVDFLLKREFDPYLNVEKHLRNENTNSFTIPVIAAIMRNDLQFPELIKKYNFKLNQYSDLFSLQHWAAFYTNNINVAYYLVKEGVDPHTFITQYKTMFRDYSKKTLLLISEFITTISQWNDYQAQFKKLNANELAYIRKNINSNMDALSVPEFVKAYKIYLEKPCLQHPEKRTNFVLNAIKNNDLQAFQHAVSEGFDISKEDTEVNFSLLIMALEKGHMELARKMIVWGFDINIRDNNKQTLLHRLAANRNDRKKNAKLIKNLIDLNAEINLQDIHGKTPVFIATENNNVEAMKVFLDQKQKCLTVVHFNEASYNLLTHAFAWGSHETVNLLLDRKFDPYLNIQDYLQGKVTANFQIPILSAINRGDTSFLDLLPQHKHKLNKYPQISGYQLLLALREKNIKMAYYLVKQGLDAKTLKDIYLSLNEIPDEATISLMNEFHSTVDKWNTYQDEYKNLSENQLIQIKNIHPDIDDLSIPEFNLAFQDHKDREDWYTLKRLSGAVALLMVLLAAIFNTFKKNNTPEQVEEITNETKPVTKQKKTKKGDSNKIANKTIQSITETEIKHEKPKETLLPNEGGDKLILITQILYLCNQVKENIYHEQNSLINAKIKYNRESYNQVKLEDGYRKDQIELNNKIKSYHKTCDEILKIIVSAKIGKDAVNILNDLEEELKISNKSFTIDYLNNCKIQISSLKTSNLEIKRLCEEEVLKKTEIDKIEFKIQSDKNKKRIDSQKIIIDNNNKSSAREIRPENTEIRIEPVANTVNTNKKPAIPIHSNKIEIKTNKEKKPEIKNVMHKSMDMRISMYSLDIKETIKSDRRISRVIELLLLIEVMRKNHNIDDQSENDAILYLLMKASHIIGQLSSENYGYKNILIDFQHRLYDIRNNIVHYPDLCIKTTDMTIFLNTFFEIFFTPLKELKEKGTLQHMDTARLYEISPFMLTDHRVEDHIEIKTDIDSCIKQLSVLCYQAERYVEIAEKHGIEFELSGSLHCAMHILMLRLREAVKMLIRIDYPLFDEINKKLPEIISIGDMIAHKIINYNNTPETTDKKTYSLYEDIDAGTLLGHLKKIPEKLLSIIKPECKNQIIFMKK